MGIEMNTSLNFGSLIVDDNKFQASGYESHAKILKSHRANNLIEKFSDKNMDVVATPALNKGKMTGISYYLREKDTLNSRVSTGGKKVRYTAGKAIPPSEVFKILWQKAQRVGLKK